MAVEQLPGPPEHTVQHLLRQPPRARVLLPQLNVSTPKRASRERLQQRERDDRGSPRGVEASHDRRRRERVGRRHDRAGGRRRLPTAARNERVTGPGDRAHRREHQANGVEGKRAGSSGCESWSEVRVQGSHLPAGAIGCPSRSAWWAARSGRRGRRCEAPGALAVDGAG
jgi:hypothetical protein